MRKKERQVLQLSDSDRKIGTFLVYAYLLFYYVRPQEYIPGLGSIPVTGVLFLLLTIWGVFHIRTFLFRTPIVIVLMLGVLYLVSSFGAVNVSGYKIAFLYVTQLFPQCLAIYILIDSKERIINLINWWCLLYFLIALITFYNGGLGPGDFTRDPNDAALALSMGIPWVYYSIQYVETTKFQYYFRWLILVCLIGGVVITSSRGGFLGLVAVIGVIWWFSHKRIRNLFLGVTSAILLSGIIVVILPSGYMDEMQSINNAEDSTRVERFRTWEVAWIMYKDNPVLGVGVNNFAWYVSKYQPLTSWWTGEQKSLTGRVTHSVYFQFLSELGTVGAIIFLYIMIFLPIKLNKILSGLTDKTEDEKFVKLLTQTLIVSMVAFVISGAFISVAYYPHLPIWITMYAILKRYAESMIVVKHVSIGE